jgi:hypothetical protein
MTYLEKLRDPKWQNKRLQVLKRDNFTCKYCGDKSKTLHVHHNTYTYGLEPWEYSNNNLTTVCATCHNEEESNKMLFNDIVYDMLLEGLRYQDLHLVLSIKFRKTLNGKEVENGNI